MQTLFPFHTNCFLTLNAFFFLNIIQVIGDELVVASTSNELYTLSGHSDTDDNDISYYVEKNVS